MLAGCPDYRGQGGPPRADLYARRRPHGGTPVVQALIRACGSPLACTSANTHGTPAPASFADVEDRILEGVDLAVDAGETPCRDASTIVTFKHGELQILRQGALPASEIERVLSDPMQ